MFNKNNKKNVYINKTFIYIFLFFILLSIITEIFKFNSLKTYNLVIKNKKTINDIYDYMNKNNLLNQNTDNNTLHQWNENINLFIKNKINIINNEILEIIGYEYKYVPTMTELYWSSKKNNNSDQQYVNNHADGPFFYCNLYRALIIIDGNKNINTVFTKENIDINLKKYDMLIFDYDKSYHYIYVNKDKKDNNQRIIIKLHYVKNPLLEHCKMVHCLFGRETRDLFERNKKNLYIDGIIARGSLHYYTYKIYILIFIILLFIYNLYVKSITKYILYLFVLIEIFSIIYILHFNFIKNEKCELK